MAQHLEEGVEVVEQVVRVQLDGGFDEPLVAQAVDQGVRVAVQGEGEQAPDRGRHPLRQAGDRAGHLLAVLHFSGPQRAGLLHADPHPGNYRLMPDGRLGVIDFGATARLPDGHPEPIGRLVRWALEGRAEEVLADLRTEGFVRPSVQVDAEAVLDYLRPLLEPVASPRFRFTRAWMQEQAARIGDPRTEANKLGRQLNLPPAYLLIHRVTIGSIGVLCQLDAAADWHSIIEEWLPGFRA